MRVPCYIYSIVYPKPLFSTFEAPILELGFGVLRVRAWGFRT